MSPLRTFEDQTVLFADAQLRSHAVPLPPLRELPIAERETIDLARAAKILAVTEGTVKGLIRRGLIRHYRVSVVYRVDYWSVVQFCDGLRLKHALPTRRPVPGGFRPKDHEILPFPISETIYVDAVMAHLNISQRTVLNLLEEGALAGYQLLPVKRSPWRIHQPSVNRYIDRMHEQAGQPSRQTAASA